MTTSEEVGRRIRKVFIEAVSPDLSEESLRFTERLDEVAGLDSIALMEFVVAIEKEFGFTFEPEQLCLELFRDLDRLTAHVVRRVEGARP